MQVAGADAVLAYWFGDAATDPVAAEARRSLWFGGSADVDATIATRFGATLEAAVRGELESWQGSPRGTLAYILVCDQFPRNVWRGTPRAFALDAQALAAARHLMASGQFVSLTPGEKAFALLPFEHSESLDDQRTCVAHFETLVREVPDAWRAQYEGYLDYARQHLALIERFGRFPHRNRVLGRESSAAELAFLEAGGATFGQA
ncbi:MAG: DUF924 domain-containing protein [Steroidobacteraceae bacterium]|nr:DUF924 domain-containing protein [Steroidobacteraceae bacterium]MCW5573506.1 DUF924 domain-containing protein [Steroidobacteraceae bacterium]